MTNSPTTPIDTLLLFADISGYTRYIRDNAYTAVHALQNIRDLLDAVLDTLEPEFTLAKLEGDAAFAHTGGDAFDGTNSLPDKLLATFAAFDTSKQQLMTRNVCECTACRLLPNLELKIILHQGHVLHYRARRTNELGGLPVIVLHRLSKNGVGAKRYVLWTLPLSPRMQALQPISRRSEHHDELGSTEVEVFELAQSQPAAGNATRLEKWRDHLRKALPWWRLQLLGKPGRSAAFSTPEDTH